MSTVLTVTVKSLVIFAVYSAFAVARRFLPPSQPKSEPELSEAELSVRFATVQWGVSVAMLAIGITFALSTHALLIWLNRSYSMSRSAEGIRLWPQNAIWWFFPGFCALALAWELTLFLWSVFGSKETASLYDEWSSRKAGFNCTKMLRFLFFVVALPIGVLTVLALPMHSTLRQDSIVSCGYAFAPCQTYRYADATRMTQIDGFRNRDGKFTARAGIIVDFRDGRRWSSTDWGDFQKSVDPKMRAYLIERTGQGLAHVATEAEIGMGE